MKMFEESKLFAESWNVAWRKKPSGGILSDCKSEFIVLKNGFRYWADWCGPCKMQAPIVDAVCEEFGDQVKVCKVNVDEQASLALNYQITSIPTLIFMKYGIFQQRMVGLQSKEVIVEYLKTLLDE